MTRPRTRPSSAMARNTVPPVRTAAKAGATRRRISGVRSTVRAISQWSAFLSLDSRPCVSWLRADTEMPHPARGHYLRPVCSNDARPPAYLRLATDLGRRRARVSVAGAGCAWPCLLMSRPDRFSSGAEPCAKWSRGGATGWGYLTRRTRPARRARCRTRRRRHSARGPIVP